MLSFASPHRTESRRAYGRRWRHRPSGSIRTGFTLIELLVVIAIFAVLAGIWIWLLPETRGRAVA